MSQCVGDCLYWFIDLVVVLRLRHGENADWLDERETRRTADSIHPRITMEFGDEGDGRGLDSFCFAKSLAKIIDDYTPL